MRSKAENQWAACTLGGKKTRLYVYTFPFLSIRAPFIDEVPMSNTAEQKVIADTRNALKRFNMKGHAAV